MADVRVSPPRVFGGAARAPRPPQDAGGAVDAHRQTGFVLGDEADLVVEGLEREAAVAGDAAGAKYRKPPVAFALAFWSRSWLGRLEALHAVEWGNYAAAVPLVLSAAEQMAASLAVLTPGAREVEDWVAAGGVANAPERHGTRLPGASISIEGVLAGHEGLAAVHAAAERLAQPDLGTTLVLAGGESAPGRLAVTFADRDFHAGLAELVLGWLLEAGAAQAEALVGAADGLPVADPDGLRDFAERARTKASDRRRCRAIVAEGATGPELTIENWRRASGGAGKRIVL